MGYIYAFSCKKKRAKRTLRSIFCRASPKMGWLGPLAAQPTCALLFFYWPK
jgi:hypothetical protein